MDREFGHTRSLRRSAALAVVAVAMVAGCGAEADAPTGCADVIAVEVATGAAGARTLSVTVRSDDVGWDGYADRWEVLVDGTVVAERVLTHPHVNEQPFTRSQDGLVLEAGSVTVRAHHSTGGYCGSDRVVILD